MLYSLLLFDTQLGPFEVFTIVAFSLVVVSTVCSVLRMGSGTIRLSTNVLHYAKAWKGCPWSKKFFKSCPPIAIRVGEFHKMDSERAPAYVRFVLQRTLFLVVKTKLNLGNEVNGD